MPDFKDASGNAWNIRIDYDTAKRVRDLAHVNLLAVDEDLFTRLADPFCLVETLYAICKPQADHLEMTAAKFGQGFNGESIEAATEALIDGIIDFFPPRRRAVLTELRRATNKVMEKKLVAAEAATANGDLEAAIERAIDESLLRKPNAGSTKSLDGSAV